MQPRKQSQLQRPSGLECVAAFISGIIAAAAAAAVVDTFKPLLQDVGSFQSE